MHAKIITPKFMAFPQQLRTGMKQDSSVSRLIWFYRTHGGGGVIWGSFSSFPPLFPPYFLRSQPLSEMVSLYFLLRRIFPVQIHTMTHLLPYTSSYRSVPITTRFMPITNR